MWSSEHSECRNASNPSLYHYYPLIILTLIGGEGRNRTFASGRQRFRSWRSQVRNMARAPSIVLDWKGCGSRPTFWSECAIPNSRSPVGFPHFNSCSEIEEALQRPVLALVGPRAVFFPKPDHRNRNSHPFSQFGLVKALFETGCVNAVTERFQGCRERLFEPTICRNMAA